MCSLIREIAVKFQKFRNQFPHSNSFKNIPQSISSDDWPLASKQSGIRSHRLLRSIHFPLAHAYWLSVQLGYPVKLTKSISSFKYYLIKNQIFRILEHNVRIKASKGKCAGHLSRTEDNRWTKRLAADDRKV